MELEGAVKIIEETKTYGNNGFRKRGLVLITERESQYPQMVMIEFVQDKVDLLDKVAEGELIKVHINIGGRMWTNPQGEDQYFNSITGWRIESLSPASPAAQEPKEQFPNEPQSPPDNFKPSNDLEVEEDHDDLPF
jgi:hypothetical protein